MCVIPFPRFLVLDHLSFSFLNTYTGYLRQEKDKNLVHVCACLKVCDYMEQMKESYMES